MTFFSKIDGLRTTMKSGLASRLLAATLGGSLNQRVIIVLGLAIVAASLYWVMIKLWQPLILAAVGFVFVIMAVKDYERTSGTEG